jgi:predicted ester cyclase
MPTPCLFPQWISWGVGPKSPSPLLTTMDSTARNIATLHKALTAFNDPINRESYFDLYDEQIVLHGYTDGLTQGLTGLKTYYRQVWAALDAPHISVEDIVASGDTVACRYILSATHNGLFMGIPGTHRQFSVNGMTFLRFANGRCVERWQGMDRLSLLRQLDAA